MSSYRIAPATSVIYVLKENQDSQNCDEHFEVELNFSNDKKTAEAAYNGGNETWTWTFNANIGDKKITWEVNVSDGINGVSIEDSQVIEYPEHIDIINKVKFEIIWEEDQDDDQDE